MTDKLELNNQPNNTDGVIIGIQIQSTGERNKDFFLSIIKQYQDIIANLVMDKEKRLNNGLDIDLGKEAYLNNISTKIDAAEAMVVFYRAELKKFIWLKK